MKNKSYDDMTSWVDADPNFIEALSNWEKSRNETTSFYAASLNNLVRMYRATGRHFEAELYEKELSNLMNAQRNI